MSCEEKIYLIIVIFVFSFIVVPIILYFENKKFNK
jgi:hypothetical protein